MGTTTASQQDTWFGVLERLGLSEKDQIGFVHFLGVALAVKNERRRPHRNPGDILALIEQVRDVGDLDEAVWRTFLAGHFGRTSINPGERDSARDLLCAFTEQPVWTWARVSAEPDMLKGWLVEHSKQIELLTFGNHRRRRNTFNVASLWQVLKSFFDNVAKSGGLPSQWIAAAPDVITDEDRFDELYCKIDAIWDFGRLGAFDTVELLSDLRIVRAEPGSCYLPGATGPLEAARSIWLGRPPRELNRLATQLARDLVVSPAILEDALCNWQK